MKICLAATGASGSIYAQRLLDEISREHELFFVLSGHATEVADQEISGYRIPPHVRVFNDRSMQVPVVSGSSRIDAMVIAPCSMGTLGRIAQGFSDSVIARAADVFLKEKRKLILVPRETPWNLIHARNVVTLLEAGAIVLPAIPSFYGRPQSIQDVVDTVVARILDQLGIENTLSHRWKEEEKK